MRNMLCTSCALVSCVLALTCNADDARFDLVGPKIDVRVTRGDQTLPIASVPNLQAGDKLWLHPELPPTQSIKYILVCVFLRGTTNPPPDDWFIRIETWNKKVRDEGVFVTVPAEAQQALLMMAPETSGDFSTIRNAVRGRPGIFVRASQDLIQAGFEQARIEKYLASIRRVPPADATQLQKHSDLLAATLALRPNPDCFKRPVDMQFNCLTQVGSQMLLDDGHGQSVVASLANGPNSDFINAASATSLAGGGVYSAYVGAVVDLARILGNLHLAQYQYIPAIAFPQDDAMNLRLSTPPSFRNPKSVLVIGLPSIQAAVPPPLRPVNPDQVACLLKPELTLPVEGAPLIFSTDFAHGLVLHLNTPTGAPTEPDIPLRPDAYQGGLVLQRDSSTRVPLRDVPPVQKIILDPTVAATHAPSNTTQVKVKALSEPVEITGNIQGMWGFDPFTGPTIHLQQLPGTGWRVVTPPNAKQATLIIGQATDVSLASTGGACVSAITMHTTSAKDELKLAYAAAKGTVPANQLTISLPGMPNAEPGDLALTISQYGEKDVTHLAVPMFATPAQVKTIRWHAGDTLLTLTGDHLDHVQQVAVGAQIFQPDKTSDREASSLELRETAKPGAMHEYADEHLTVIVTLVDGRTLPFALTVLPTRPQVTLLHEAQKTAPNNMITLSGTDDLPLSSTLVFTIKSREPFPRNGQLEIATEDETLRTVLTLAPSGGMVLQDPHTIVATLDPLRSFGPSAFGAIRFRAIYPAMDRPADSHKRLPDGEEKTSMEGEKPSAATAPAPETSISDWQHLTTLVRLPSVSQLTCPADAGQPCTIAGDDLFLVAAVATTPAFADAIAVPDGYTATTLNIPHAAVGTIYLHLRDDPTALATVTFPPPPATVADQSTHAAAHKAKP